MKLFSRTLTVAGLCLAAVAIPLGAAATTESFPAAGTPAAIADGGSSPFPNYGASTDVTFLVENLTNPASDIEVSMTFSPLHNWMGDLDVVLYAPDGTSFVIFSRVGVINATGTGDSSDLNGTYTFTDSAPVNFGNAAFDAGGSTTIASGSYRTTAAGGAGQIHPAPATNLTAGFAGIADVNGTWTLRLRDAAAGGATSITAATLTITDPSPSPDPDYDFDGDGLADFSIVRGESGNLGWWVLNSSGGSSYTQFGLVASDVFVPADYDGDGKTDRAVWRGTGSPAFYILESATLNVRTVPFGVPNDIPVAGDWDGDGKADPSVFRPSTGTFYYLGSLNNPGNDITFVPFGQDLDRPIPADYDGDGTTDAAIARDVGGQIQVWILRSGDSGVEVQTFGLATDSIVPGDRDGDGKADLTMVRNQSGSLKWWVLFRTGSVSQFTFGLSTDFKVSGDYDGDGKTDVAVYRASNGRFYVLRSSDFGVTYGHWGAPGDFPLGASYVQ